MTRLRQALQAPEPTLDVHRVLNEAHLAQMRIELEPVTQTSAEHQVLRTTIEQVDEDSFVITQPVVGGAVRPLARFEPHHIRLVTNRGIISGQTHALGRAKVRAGAGEGEEEDAFIYGYRLAFPPTLQITERRQPLRTLFGRSGLPEAELHVLSHRGPIIGLLEDLNAAGAKLRCRNAKNLERGGTALFKLELPDPFGSVHAMARVVAIDPADTSGDHFVRVAFDARNETIETALQRGRPSPATRAR